MHTEILNLGNRRGPEMPTPRKDQTQELSRPRFICSVFHHTEAVHLFCSIASIRDRKFRASSLYCPEPWSLKHKDSPTIFVS